MATINTSRFAKDLYEGVRKWYGMEYQKYPLQYPELFEKVKTNKAFEEEVGTSWFGLVPEKTQGSALQVDDATQAFIARYSIITYGLKYIVTMEMIEDGIAMGEVLRKTKALAFSMRTTKETIAANVLNRAFNSSYTMGSDHDGKELCSTAHPNQKGGTFSNRASTDVDLSEDALEQACIDIDAFTTDSGLQIGVKAKKLIVHPNDRFEAQRILKSELQNDTANNAINALRTSAVLEDGYCVNNFLTDTDAWFVKSDSPDSLKYFERKADTFDMDNDFDTKNLMISGMFRCKFGWSDPRGIWGSSGS